MANGQNGSGRTGVSPISGELTHACLAFAADGRFWWIKLKALATASDWQGLEAFAKSKKSPIGYEPFVVSSTLSVRGRAHARPIC
jgi:hypothetical protein